MEGDRRTRCGWCCSVYSVLKFFHCIYLFILCVHVCVYNIAPVERSEDNSGGWLSSSTMQVSR